MVWVYFSYDISLNDIILVHIIHIIDIQIMFSF